jgi:hypothetical protein
MLGTQQKSFTLSGRSFFAYEKLAGMRITKGG